MNGIHHVTAIAGPARRNLDFYTRVLGLRLVKKTVNFDDPGTYHFYFGDEAGRPGTILTFFPWEHTARGRLGVGETEETRFRVPSASLGYWTHRLLAEGVTHDPIEARFGERVIPFRDPDGTRLALVGVAAAENEPGWISNVPAEHALRGFHSAGLLLEDGAATGAILTDVLGFTEAARDGTTTRYKVAGNPLGGIVDVRSVGGFPRGVQGAGTVHHIAFRAADDAAELAMRERLRDHHRIQTTEQKDRNYFRSIYFREPGGILFEIATDIPGFAVDEPAESLGTALKLPPQYEGRRASIEAMLPDLED